MKLYSITDNYINYLRKYENRVYDNKEDIRKVTRKYLGIVLKINDFNYYIPMSSPKKSDYKDNEIRKSIVPIVRMISQEEVDRILLTYYKADQDSVNLWSPELFSIVIILKV